MNSLVVQWLRLHGFTAEGLCSISGQGTKIPHVSMVKKEKKQSARFGSTYTKIGTIQRRLAWPLRKDDTQIREAFHIKKKKKGRNGHKV